MCCALLRPVALSDADLVLATRWLDAMVVAMGGCCLLDAELVLAIRWVVDGGCYGWMLLVGC